MNDSTQPDPTPSPDAQYKPITQEEFDAKLETHRQWLKLAIDQRPEHEDMRLNLDGYDLRNLNLVKIDLNQSHMNGVNLEGVDLSESNLRGCRMRNSNLAGTSLEGSNLMGANFDGAHLKGASLNYSDMDYTKFPLANLEGAFLTGCKANEAYFLDANLRNAKLQNINLKKANLTNANLQGAILNDADLTGADLTHATFQDASLVKANLTDTNTSGTKFGGADFTNATLPSSDFFNGRLNTLEDASKNSRTIFLTILTALAFSGLSIFSTKDFDLVTNTSNFQLPLIQSSIPIIGFYYLAPILVAGLFFYFHVYLQHVYRLASQLPAKFTDGSPFGDKVYPWMPTTFLEMFFKRLHPDDQSKPPGQTVRKWFVIFLAWASTPIILFLFWLRYLCLHDPWGTGLHIILFLSCVLGARYSWVITKETMQFKEQSHWNFKRLFKEDLWCGLPAFILTITLTITAFWLDSTSAPGHKKIFALNLERAEYPEKPTDWGSYDKNQILKYLKGIRGLDLSDKNLRSLYAPGSFFPKSVMNGANLKNSDLRSSDLQRAQLVGTKFNMANLERANFFTANVLCADFREAENLTVEQIKNEAVNWQTAFYTNEFRKKLNMPDSFIKKKLLPICIEEFLGKKSEKSVAEQTDYFYKFYGLDKEKETKPTQAPQQ